MKNLENEYRSVKSIMRGPTALIQQAFDLQAKAECSCENGDRKAQDFFTKKINDLVSKNPSLKDPMNDLGRYLGVI